MDDLEDIYQTLEQDFEVSMSRADFWILAGIVSYEATGGPRDELT